MNIDWTKIEGYREDMTADEKLELLNGYEPQSTQSTSESGTATADETDKSAPKSTPVGKGTVTKAQFDKVSSELAAAKKALRSKMTESEQAEAERREADEAMRAELETLRHEKTLSTYKASYLSLGYDDKLANEAATAMADGDTDTMFAIMKQHSITTEKALRAKLLKETPVPPAGDDPEAEKQKKQIAELRRSFGLPV